MSRTYGHQSTMDRGDNGGQRVMGRDNSGVAKQIAMVVWRVPNVTGWGIPWGLLHFSWTEAVAPNQSQQRRQWWHICNGQLGFTHPGLYGWVQSPWYWIKTDCCEEVRTYVHCGSQGAVLVVLSYIFHVLLHYDTVWWKYFLSFMWNTSTVFLPFTPMGKFALPFLSKGRVINNNIKEYDFKK